MTSLRPLGSTVLGAPRSRTAILTGNTPLRPDYRMAARSGFVASAAPAPPPKVSFRSSPPPRSAHLGSRIPLGRPASPRPTPAPNPYMDHLPPAAPPVSQYTIQRNDACAAAKQLSSALLPRLGPSSTCGPPMRRHPTLHLIRSP